MSARSNSRTANLPPDLLRLERKILQDGFSRIAGVDEVGRGCLAGPVFAASVIFPSHLILNGVDDSKKLSPSERDHWFEEILRVAVSWSVASVEASEIDTLNIHHASLKAMALAVRGLSVAPDFVLVDGRFPLAVNVAQRAVIGGDGLSQSVAAASILAKVSRDRWIAEEGRRYPGFSFARHKGYGTEAHRREIRKNGITPLHRRSFRLGIF